MKEHFELTYSVYEYRKPAIPFICFPTAEEAKQFNTEEMNNPTSVSSALFFREKYYFYNIKRFVHD